MERDDTIIYICVFGKISTHTLTWSVTFETVPLLCSLSISTHTLTWSVTFLAKRHINHVFISTHTLTWSVTSV